MNQLTIDKIYDDGVLEADVLSNGWVFICWVNNKIGYLPKSLIKALRKVESIIVDRDLNGWFCNSEKDHVGMHKIIEKVGAKRLKENDDLVWFKKEII